MKNKSSQKNMLLTAIFIVAVFSISLIVPFATQAQTPTPPPTPAPPPTPTGPSSPGASSNTFGSVMGNFAQLTTAGGINALAGLLSGFNYVISFLIPVAAGFFDVFVGLAGTSLLDVQTIYKGWVIVRDIANLFFIFFLLIIAIATILRIEQYGAKQLLVKLIVVALFINFSLVIGGVVIDASNVLGRVFVNAMSPISEKIVAVTELSSLNSTVKPTGFCNIPPNVKTSGFSATALWYNVAVSLCQFKEPPPGYDFVTGIFDADKTKNEMNEAATALMIEVFRMSFMLVALFVFVAHGILLVIRSVGLIMLLILSPFGFLFLVLPQTRGIAMQWWRQLFSWSLYFPIAMFFIYLAVSFGFELKAVVRTGNLMDNVGKMIVYASVVVFLMASMIVARQCGIYGAGTAIAMGSSLRRRLQGYAGKTTMAGIYAAGRTAARGTGEKAGKFAEKLGEKGSFGRFAAKPFARLQAAGEKATETRTKKYEEALKRSNDSFKASYAAAVTEPERRAARQAAIEQGKAHLIPEEDIKKDIEIYRTKKDIKALRNIAKVNPKLLTRVGESVSDALKDTKVSLSPQDVKELRSEAIGDKDVIRGIVETQSPKSLQAFAESSNEAYDATISALKDIAALSGKAAPNLDDLADVLDTLGNKASARYFRASPSRNIFDIT